MKKTLLFTSLILILMTGSSQTDTIYHFTNDSSLFIFDKFDYNCAAGFVVKMYSSNNTYSIYAEDTIPEMANCICNFEILTEIKNLQPGIYSFLYYRIDKFDDTTLIYSFNYSNDIQPISIQPESNFIAGDCGESILTAIDCHKPKPVFSLYPMPVTSNLWIEYSGKTSGLQLALYNSSGFEILKFQIKENQYFIDMSPFLPGLYFITIRTGNYVYSKKIIKTQ